MTAVSERRLVIDTLWNLAGQVGPLIAAAAAIPILIAHIGVERFGVLSLGWVLIGYFSLFDFGMGRALTKLIAERIGHESEKDVAALSWTALVLMAVFGVCACLLILVFRERIADVLHVSASLRAEVLQTFMLLGMTVPLVILTTGLRGVLEAYHQFKSLNLVRLPLGVYNYVGPLIALPFSDHLPLVVLMLAIGRVVGLVAHLWLCMRLVPELQKISVDAHFVRPLLRFGGWMTVTNIVSPLMVSMDRFFIGAVLSATAVAYYSTPYEMIVRLQILPTALVTVLFPTFSTLIAKEPQKALDLYYRSMAYISAVLFFPVLICVIFGRQILQLWVGGEFAQNSVIVLQVLAISQLVNGVARVPFTLLQGAGRPALTAGFHLAELFLYVPVIYWLAARYGINGVAISFLIRVSIDLVLLVLACGFWVGGSDSRKGRNGVLIAFCSALLLFAVGFLPVTNAQRVIYLLAAVMAFSILFWTKVLHAADRSVLLKKIGAIRA